MFDYSYSHVLGAVTDGKILKQKVKINLFCPSVCATEACDLKIIKWCTKFILAAHANGQLCEAQTWWIC